MNVEQIISLSNAGFSAEQITTMITALGGERQEQPQEAPQEQPQAQQQETPQEAPQEQPQEQPQDEATPAWFNRFLQKYTADYEQLAQGIQARNVRRAGSDPGVPQKTPEQLMAEAFNNIR